MLALLSTSMRTDMVRSHSQKAKTPKDPRKSLGIPRHAKTV